MESAGVTLRHAKHHAPFAESLDQRAAQLRHTKRFVVVGAPAALALRIRLQGPEINEAFAAVSARPLTVVRRLALGRRALPTNGSLDRCLFVESAPGRLAEDWDLKTETELMRLSLGRAEDQDSVRVQTWTDPRQLLPPQPQQLAVAAQIVTRRKLRRRCLSSNVTISVGKRTRNTVGVAHDLRS